MNTVTEEHRLPLAEQLAADDAAENRGMHGDERLTCHTHQSWVEDCVTDPMHANPVTGYNWCGPCWSPVQRCGCRQATVAGLPCTTRDEGAREE